MPSGCVIARSQRSIAGTRAAQLAPPARAVGDAGAERADGVEQVEHVLERERVVHRAALELAAVGEDLLGQLAGEDVRAAAQPGVGFAAGEEEAGDDERLGVGEQVVAEQVRLEPLRQPARLHGEACDHAPASRRGRPSSHWIQRTMRSDSG